MKHTHIQWIYIVLVSFILVSESLWKWDCAAGGSPTVQITEYCVRPIDREWPDDSWFLYGNCSSVTSYRSPANIRTPPWACAVFTDILEQIPKQKEICWWFSVTSFDFLFGIPLLLTCTLHAYDKVRENQMYTHWVYKTFDCGSTPRVRSLKRWLENDEFGENVKMGSIFAVGWQVVCSNTFCS